MKKGNKGFSLVELSIVLVIVGLLVAMSFSLGSGQINVVNIKFTQKKLDRIDQAIATYLKTKKALPCPADATAAIANIGQGTATINSGLKYLTISSVNNNTITTIGNHNLLTGDEVYIEGTVIDNGGYVVTRLDNTRFRVATAYIGTAGWGGTVRTGYSNSTCTAANIIAGTDYYVGMVPIRTLGLSDDYAFDAWGDRISYAVSRKCIDPDNWSAISANKCTNVNGVNGGSITVQDLNNTAKTVNAAYIVFSLGKNGLGAWNRSGTRNASAGNAKEISNSNTYATAVFNEGPINDAKIAANYFDDIIHWKTPQQVWDDAQINEAMQGCGRYGRMVVALNSPKFTCQSGPSRTPEQASNPMLTDDFNGAVPESWNYYKAPADSNPTLDSVQITIPAERKFFQITAICGSSSSSSHTVAADGRSALRLKFEDGAAAEISSYYICYNNTTAIMSIGGYGISSDTITGGSLYIPIPTNAKKMYIQGLWQYNVDPQPEIRARWYFQ